MWQASPQRMDSSSAPRQTREPPAHSQGHKEGVSLLPGARGAGGVKLLAPRVLSPPTCEVFKNKIQPSTSEDLIGFTEGLNNIPCSEERERKAYKMEGFYKLVRRGKKY